MPRKFLFSVYAALWNTLDVLLPPECAGCGKHGVQLCSDCLGKINPPNGNLCSVCGLPHGHISRVCETCTKDPPHYDQLRAWAVFDSPVREMLHKLKYGKNIPLGFVIARNMVEFVEALNWPVQVIIPIPLGRKRLHERGYNQSAMIAKPLSMALGVEYHPGGLYRIKETRSQVGLSQIERKQNMHEAFEADKRLAGKTVLLVDDVSTTGSTLSSAAVALKKAGAGAVYALTVARALSHHGLRNA